MGWFSDILGFFTVTPVINNGEVLSIIYQNNLYKTWDYSDGKITGKGSKYGNYYGLDILIYEITKAHPNIKINGKIEYSNDACTNWELCLIRCIDNKLIYCSLPCVGLAYHVISGKEYDDDDLLDKLHVYTIDNLSKKTLCNVYILSYGEDRKQLIYNFQNKLFDKYLIQNYVDNMKFEKKLNYEIKENNKVTQT